MLETPQIVETQVQLTASLRLNVPRTAIRKVMGPGLEEVKAVIAAQGIASAGPWLTHHFRMDPEVFDFEICVPVATPVAPSGRVTPGAMPAGKAARAVYRGPYDGLPDAWREFDAWVAARGLAIAGDAWESYAVGPETNPDPGAWRTQLNRPLRP